MKLAILFLLSSASLLRASTLTIVNDSPDIVRVQYQVSFDGGSAALRQVRLVSGASVQYQLPVYVASNDLLYSTEYWDGSAWQADGLPVQYRGALWPATVTGDLYVVREDTRWRVNGAAAAAVVAVGVQPELTLEEQIELFFAGAGFIVPILAVMLVIRYSRKAAAVSID